MEKNSFTEICNIRLQHALDKKSLCHKWDNAETLSNILTEVLEKYGLLTELKYVDAEFFIDSFLLMQALSFGSTRRNSSLLECAQLLNLLLKGKGLQLSSCNGEKVDLSEDEIKEGLILQLYSKIYKNKEKYEGYVIEHGGRVNNDLTTINIRFSVNELRSHEVQEDNAIIFPDVELLTNDILQSTEFVHLIEKVLSIEEEEQQTLNKLLGKKGKRNDNKPTSYPLLGYMVCFLYNMNIDIINSLTKTNKYCFLGDLVKYAHGVNFPEIWNNKSTTNADKYRLVRDWIKSTPTNTDFILVPMNDK